MTPGWAVRLLRLWAPLLAGLAVSFYLSSLPGANVPSVVPDYVAHTVEYAILGTLALRAFHGGLGLPMRARPAGLAVALCVLWGISDEVHQIWVPGRESSLSDLLTDVVGVLAAGLLFAWLPRWRRKA